MTSAHRTAAEATAADAANHPGTPAHPGGIHVPLVTPFDARNTVDARALQRLAHRVLDDGAAGLVALGTTAEAASLDAAERHTVVQTLAGVARRRGALLTVGLAGGSTEACRAQLAALAALAPHAYALVPVPAYVRAGEQGVLAHYRALAADAPLPLLAYHIPYRTAQHLGADALLQLAALPGVVGVKYATGALDPAALTLLTEAPADFTVLAGDDLCLSPFLALGAHGGILAAAHLATARFVRLAAAWREGDLATAARLTPPLARLASAAFAEPNPSVLKAVLHARAELPTADVRLPLLPASREALSVAARRAREAEADAPARQAAAVG